MSCTVVSRSDPIEDLRLAAHVELRGGLIEQHHACSRGHGAQRPREGHSLPLTARELGAIVIAAGQHRGQSREIRGTCRFECPLHHLIGRASRRDVVAKRKLQPEKVLEHTASRIATTQIEGYDVDTVDLVADCGS